MEPQHKLRVAFFTHRFPDLTATFIAGQITGLVKRGHTVEIFAGRPGARGAGASFDETPACRIRPISDFSMSRLAWYRVTAGRWLRLLLASPASAFRCLRLLNPLLRNVQRTKLFATGIAIADTRFDIAHAHYGPNGLHAIHLQRVGLLRCPVIVTFHGHDANVAPRTKGPNMYEPLFARAAICFVGTQFMRQRLLELGASPERVRIHPAGVDTEIFKPAEREPETGSELQTLTVARLSEEKGIEYGIRACAKAAAAGCRVRYRIAGAGGLLEKLRAIVTELDAGSYVELLGPVPHGQLPELFRQAEVFLLPSIRTPSGAEEGQGVALLEAEACGVPAISTPVGGIPECVRDGETAFLVAEKDADAIADKIMLLAADPVLRTRMGMAGRVLVLREFDQQVLDGRLERLYRELCGAVG